MGSRSYRDSNPKWVSLQFTDLLGQLREVIVSGKEMTEENINEGFSKLDGSSIPGFMGIEESDMVLKPDMSTAKKLPWKPDTQRIINDIYYNRDRQRFEKDPRYTAQKADADTNNLGYHLFYGPEMEFFIVDNFKFDNATPSSGLGYKIYSSENPATGTAPTIPYKAGYYATQPSDKTYGVRSKIAEMLSNDFDFKIEAAHHEVATNGQVEIDFRFGKLLDTADKVQTLKYVARNVAYMDGKIATFLPKPFFGDNGSGMHVNLSFWDTKDSANLFYDKDDSYAQLSQLGRYAVGGILYHSPALSAIVSPTTNSYRRLTPGFEAPIYIAWGRANRSAIIRVPAYKMNMLTTKRLEYRAPDTSANPYLVFSAVAMAAMDGVINKREPGDPVNKSIYKMSRQEIRDAGIKELPKNLEDALSALDSDRQFLHSVFSDSLLDTYININLAEARDINRYPNPVEIERLISRGI